MAGAWSLSCSPLALSPSVARSIGPVILSTHPSLSPIPPRDMVRTAHATVATADLPLRRAIGRGKEDDPWSDLTSQEQKILELIAEGKTNKENSEMVNLSDKTVKNYVSNILGKLEVSHRSQAAAFVAERRARSGFREPS